MPTISIFYGIVIQMFWREHNPPHFHALYGEHEPFSICGISACYEERCPVVPWDWYWNGQVNIEMN
jgi:hypothetical protein